MSVWTDDFAEFRSERLQSGFNGLPTAEALSVGFEVSSESGQTHSRSILKAPQLLLQLRQDSLLTLRQRLAPLHQLHQGIVVDRVWNPIASSSGRSAMSEPGRNMRSDSPSFARR